MTKRYALMTAVLISLAAPGYASTAYDYHGGGRWCTKQYTGVAGWNWGDLQCRQRFARESINNSTEQ